MPHIQRQPVLTAARPSVYILDCLVRNWLTKVRSVMARPREFETEEALDRGMHLLWTRGYESTSLDDLLASMGISKSSFYDTFGTKHDF